MATLTTLRAKLRKDLHDEDSANYRWVDATLDRHVERALRELSQVWPRERKTSLAADGTTRDLSLSTLTDLVRIEAVEYPVDAYPPEFVQFSVFAGVLTLLVDAVPKAAAAIRVYWGSLHTLDGTTSTLEVLAEDVVLTGAGGYAAVEWASFATNRANASGEQAFEDYGAWGEQRLRQFQQQLDALGERGRVRSGRLFAADKPGGRDVVRWEP